MPKHDLTLIPPGAYFASRCTSSERPIIIEGLSFGQYTKLQLKWPRLRCLL